MKNKKLADDLNRWFQIQNHKGINFWNQNPVAIIIKNNLSKWGNFRKKPKGFLDF
jgi:hypothetical protein